MAKLGMREDGVLRDNVLARGSWWSSIQWSILSTDPKVASAMVNGLTDARTSARRLV
jgi:hypothetical protein